MIITPNVRTSLRALARIGTTYYKQEKLELALKYFDKSLADHRNPDIVKKKIEVRTGVLSSKDSVLFFVVLATRQRRK